MPAMISGSVMLTKYPVSGLHPRCLAALLQLRVPPLQWQTHMARTISGKAMIAAASAAPFQLKANTMPKVFFRRKKRQPPAPAEAGQTTSSPVDHRRQNQR